MLKMSVLSIRWGLVASNLAAIGLTAWMAHGFFLGERDELHIDLPDPSRFVIEREDKDVGNRDELIKLLREIEFKPAPPPVVIAKDPLEQPTREGGPLAQWEVQMVIGDNGGQCSAFIQEKVVKKTQRISRATGGTRRGNRSNRRAAKKTYRSRFLQPGDEFVIDDQPYTVDRITIEPMQVVYLSGAERFTLTKEMPPSSFDGNVLRATPQDQIEKAGPSRKVPEPDVKGRIERTTPPKGSAKGSPPKSSARARKREGMEKAAKVLEERGLAEEAKKMRERFKEEKKQ